MASRSKLFLLIKAYVFNFFYSILFLTFVNIHKTLLHIQAVGDFNITHWDKLKKKNLKVLFGRNMFSQATW